MAIARLPLLLLLLLLLLLVGGSSGEEAEVVCAGAACYTLHRAQLGWNDAQKRCHHNGGKLAPAHSPAEARRLQELLVGAGWTGPAWIGLSLPRGHCVQPQEPLRGFSWVAGEEAGNYSAWLSEPAVTCLSARCVSLKLAGPAGSPGWAAHPCRTPLPAFLCKFIFQGMCGPLPLAGPGRVTYGTPFGVRSPQLAAAPFGTLAEAHCEAGGSPAFALCKKMEQGDGFAWHPPGPLCPAACTHHNGGCQHRCLEAPGEPPRCACHPGYTLAPDMASCLPEDACHPNPCQQTCRPGGPRGFECSCKAGYNLAPDGHHCLDVDECLARPCQHECHNTAGSFVCLCQPGYQPTGPGGHHCRDEDECAQPGVCPQLCLNVPGSFHCACRPGYQRQPGSDACVDVDECLRDPCPGTCHNLPGDFKCLCPHGFLPEEDGHGCRAAPTAGEEPAVVPDSTPQTTGTPWTMGALQTMGILQTTGAPSTTGIPQTLGAPIGATPPAPTAVGSAPGPEHSADGPRLLLYYILGSLVAILLLLAFSLALLACRKRAAKQEKRPAKSAADNYCWVPEQPESRGAGSERSSWEKR